MVLLALEVHDPFDRPIILAIRRVKGNSGPNASSEICRSTKAKRSKLRSTNQYPVPNLKKYDLVKYPDYRHLDSHPGQEP